MMNVQDVLHSTLSDFDSLKSSVKQIMGRRMIAENHKAHVLG